MKISSLKAHCRPRHRQGAALVIILALLVLLTGITAIFLSRALLEQKISGNSANQTKADLLARSALDVITGDLRQEIVTNSVATVVGPASNLTTLYYPNSVTNMVPQRSGNPAFTTTDPIPNLTRRSVRSDTLAVPSRASAVNSSTDGSANGRSINLTRWNSHYLIPRKNTGTTIDCTPVTTFTAPDWVFVTKAGPKVLTLPDSTVIGRYAYAIYDEGGLLDVNVAGYPSSMTAAQIGGKGSLALADLVNSGLGLTKQDVDNLVGWRNYATLQPASGTLGSFDFSSDTASATSYYAFLTNLTSGFLSVNPKKYNNRTDQTFTSRQALLKFQRSTGISQDALQYLGTFTRDLEQPSFAPDATRPKNTGHDIASATATYNGFGGNDAFDSTGKLQDLINPSYLTVRNSGGQLVMKRRFPLSRLNLLNQAIQTLKGGGSLSTANKDQIYDYFGLSWDAGNARWAYNHGSATQIYKLSEIPSGTNPDGTAREPDFFETLKSAINCDSLGKQLAGTESNGSPHSFTSGAAAIDGKVNYQLIQIAANLIDQADTDSYPTSVYFDSTEFHGVENLPYLLGWMQSWYRMKQLTSGDINHSLGTTTANQMDVAGVFPYETSVMYQPLIWNPHAPDTRTSPADIPTDFQVAGAGTAGTAVSLYPWVRPGWWTSASGPVSSFPATSSYAASAGMTAGSGGLYTFGSATIDPAISQLTFNASANTTANTGIASTFQEPYRLSRANFPAGSNAATAAGYPAGQLTIGADPDMVTAEGAASVIGIFGGKCWTGPSSITTPAVSRGIAEIPYCLSNGYASDAIQIKLQYKNPFGTSPAYLTYDTILDATTTLTFSTMDNCTYASGITDYRAFTTCFRTDPRTDRWGLFRTNTNGFSSTVNPTGITLPPNGKYNSFVYNLPQATTINPNAGVSSGTVFMLNGWNSGLPQATGWAISPQSAFDVSDLMVNLNNGSTSSALPGKKIYYTDPDGVLRRASGAFYSGNDGLPMATANYNSRPVVLNRPFQSVAEMGHAFSGTPWKNLNFFTPESGDAALLDAFCLNELANAPADVTVAGRVNLNTRQAKVLQALIQGVSKADGSVISPTEAANAAQALVTWTTDTTSSIGTPAVLSKGPLRNRGELVGKWVAQTDFVSGSNTNPPLAKIDGSLSFSGFSSMLTSGTGGVFSAASDAAIKRRRECVMRALVDSGNTRTWNLLVDVIAQTGVYPPTATAAADLAKFVVQGQSHVWVHVAIDRFTGNIIAESFEPVAD